MHRILELLSIGAEPGPQPPGAAGRPRQADRGRRGDPGRRLLDARRAAAGNAGHLPGRAGGLPAPLRATIYRLTAPLGIVAVVCLLRALMTGTTPLASLPLGPWRLVVSREGLLDGAQIAARALGSVGAIVVLCTFTQAHEIFAGLRWARLPRTWIEIAMLMVRSIFTLFEQAASVLSAQKARLGHATYRRSAPVAGQPGRHRHAALHRPGPADPRGHGRPRLPGFAAAPQFAAVGATGRS